MIRRRRPSAVAVVVAAGMLLALAGALVAAASSAPRLAGTNDLRAFLQIPIQPGDRLCQGSELVPGGAARLRLLAPGAGAGVPLEVEIRYEGEEVIRGRLSGGWEAGAVAVPLDAVTEAAVVERVCVENRGDAVLHLHGEAQPVDQGARIEAGPIEGRLRLEYLRPGSESWFELLPTMVHRFGFGRAEVLGSWSFFLAAALMLFACAAAARLVLRSRA